jgi:hypothetical protein
MTTVSDIVIWRAVVAQAFEDATARSGPLGETATAVPRSTAKFHHEKHVVTRQARDWLTGGGRDFCAVCLLADLDPDAVRERARRLAEAGWPAGPVATARRPAERSAARRDAA